MYRRWKICVCALKKRGHHYGSGIAAPFRTNNECSEQNNRVNNTTKKNLVYYLFLYLWEYGNTTTSGEPTAAQTTKNRPLDKIPSTLHFNRILACFFSLFSRAFLVVQGSVLEMVKTVSRDGWVCRKLLKSTETNAGHKRIYSSVFLYCFFSFFGAFFDEAPLLHVWTWNMCSSEVKGETAIINGL